MSFKHLILSAAVMTAGLASAPSAAAGTDAFIGEILTVGYNFCPRDTTEANGQLLPISQNLALFSLYGTTYGGDGRTTFALPDLRGRAIIHAGTGLGLTRKSLGQKGGSENVSASTQTAAKGDGVNAANSDSLGSNMQPFIAMKYCVVLQGIFPSRS